LTKEGVDNIYKTFVGKVAKGRNMTFDEVHKVAQGRVWSGTQALEQGLVDELGGLDRAVALAASLAEVKTYKVKNYPSYEKELSEVFESMPFLNAKERLLKEWVGDANFSLFQKIHNLRNVQGIQARMPFVLDIN
jgi:protease-4